MCFAGSKWGRGVPVSAHSSRTFPACTHSFLAVLGLVSGQPHLGHFWQAILWKHAYTHVGSKSGIWVGAWQPVACDVSSG